MILNLRCHLHTLQVVKLTLSIIDFKAVLVICNICCNLQTLIYHFANLKSLFQSKMNEKFVRNLSVFDLDLRLQGLIDNREHIGSVVECLIRDRGAAGSSPTGVTALWSLSKTHLS